MKNICRELPMEVTTIQGPKDLLLFKAKHLTQPPCRSSLRKEWASIKRITVSTMPHILWTFQEPWVNTTHNRAKDLPQCKQRGRLKVWIRQSRCSLTDRCPAFLTKVTIRLAWVMISTIASSEVKTNELNLRRSLEDQKALWKLLLVHKNMINT